MENEEFVLKPESATELMARDFGKGMPDALDKACCDQFAYALGLRDGTILLFESAKYVPGSEWIHLCRVTRDIAGEQANQIYRIQRNDAAGLKGKVLPIPFDRGIDVRLTDVMWASDAPWGS